MKRIHIEVDVKEPRENGQSQSLHLDLGVPSDLVQFSIIALLEFEQQPKCEVNMDIFHWATGDECFACLGGISAIKAFGPNLDPCQVDSRWRLRELAGLPDVPVGEEDQIDYLERALDNFRTGSTGRAFAIMGWDFSQGSQFTREMPDYHTEREAFIEALGQLASDMELAGY